MLQIGLIAALMPQARRRRKIEVELAEGPRELAHLSCASMLRELSGAFAHELNQPLVRRHGSFGELVVSDNGPGLTAEMMNDAFKPFISTKAGGLGLQICRTITAAHRGTPAFDGDCRRGARIVLQLPSREQAS